MSAPMDNNNTNTNNSNDSNNGGNIVPEGSTTLGHSASAAESSSNAPSSHPGSSLDRLMARIQSQQDATVPHPDQGLILDIDGVAAAHRDGGISQSNQVLAKLKGIVQSPGQILVSTYVINPQCIAAGNAYHLTVRRVGRDATGHEPQWTIRRERIGSKRCVYAALLPGDRR